MIEHGQAPFLHSNFWYNLVEATGVAPVSEDNATQLSTSVVTVLMSP